MNNFLVVEDNYYKYEAISRLLNANFESPTIVHKESISSGLCELLSNSKFNFVILDMSMPIYDITQSDPDGGGAENFGGREFLEQMQLRGVEVPVVVLSQLNTFGKGVNKKNLPMLNVELLNCFSDFYKGAVFYSSANNDWMALLLNILKN
ncbi:response regulator [Shewanella sp. SM78]|uniref:response regulator n=1 Tax=Shewanella sp. SM78 TaxID=2912810 RepID=UPI0021D8833E|nr:response regulator [Shewanella sp. SM78]MCU8024176.1 response regulator [Shewanella sp. SM78]